MVYILAVTLPAQPQLFLECVNLEQAEEWIKDGLSGTIHCKQDKRLIVVHTVPGTVYAAIPKPEFERQMAQARFKQ